MPAAGGPERRADGAAAAGFTLSGAGLMLGPTHRCFAALCGAAAAQTAGQSFTLVAMTAVVATATSNGWSSPDIDQTRTWRAVASGTPRPIRALLGHRRLTHRWGLPVLAALQLQQLPRETQWPAVALLIGWVSHLLGDALFGALPLLPWGGPAFGARLDTGGLLETGPAQIFGRRVRVLPLAPARVVSVAGLMWVLLSRPDLHAVWIKMRL